MVKKFAKNDEGVSAVIGVILMVAITVILAAVIAAFVFSMSNGVSKPYTVGITIKKDTAGNILITNVGGPDVGALDIVTVSYQVATGTPTKLGAAPDYNVADLLVVGGSEMIAESTITSDAAYTAGAQTHVIVTGQFKDGKNQVIGEADV